MTLRLFARHATPLAFLVVLAACGSDDRLTTPTAPTTPTTFTVTFTGEVNRNGAVTHTFGTQASGLVTATLNALAPDNDIVIGLSLGTWNGTACNIVLANDSAREGTVVTGAVSSFGQLCVRVYDVGNVPPGQPASYEITIVHP
jgi:hypothetical protein